MSPERILIVEAERDHAARQFADLQGPQAANERPKDQIPRPTNIRSFKIRELREMLDLAGAAHDDEWNQFRVCFRSPGTLFTDVITASSQMTVRDTITHGGIDLKSNWKSQRPQRLAKVYQAVQVLVLYHVPLSLSFCFRLKNNFPLYGDSATAGRQRTLSRILSPVAGRTRAPRQRKIRTE